ncbi:MAG: four helix bundle protein [Anaerolineae bacterium]|nr:four helix bundle protein [Anaerolineae bacterium]
MGDYRKLRAWEAGHHLVLAVYKVSGAFPKEELYGLTSQMRRAAISIPANLAEGCGRNRDAELARFAGIALGSASELEYHLFLARELGYLPQPEYDSLMRRLADLKPMLAKLIESLKPATNSR